MKTQISLVVMALAMASAVEVKPETRAMGFTYPSGSTAAYPPGTGIIYNPGANVFYSAGASVIYVYRTTISFLADTEFYTLNGPVAVLAGTNVTLGPGTQYGNQVAYGPGTSVVYMTPGETKYDQFNGNTHAIATYPQTTNVQYYYGPNGNNLILFPAGTNPMIYYNPGGSTRFGPSALPVEKEMNPPATPMTRTYGGGGYGGGSGYSYCGGYSYNGYPQTNYYNYNTGYRSSCSQTCYNCYSYSGGGGGGGGGSGGYYAGGSMGGGAYYGGGSYYGGGGGGMGGGGYGK